MTNCRLTDPEFERGVKDFLAVCNVVKVFRHPRILQIAPRPFDFWSTMCNEGELLEKFNIQLSPIPLPELTAQVKQAKEEGTEVKAVMDYCKEKMNVCVTEEQLENIAALKVLCAAWRTSTAATPWPSSAGTPCKGSWASCPARPTPS